MVSRYHKPDGILSHTLKEAYILPIPLGQEEKTIAQIRTICGPMIHVRPSTGISATGTSDYIVHVIKGSSADMLLRLTFSSELQDY